MKKYDLRKIMKRAWLLVKEAGMSISSALKKAWREAKEMTKEKFNKCAKVLMPGYDKACCTDSAYLYFSLWEKFGKSRIYVNDYKRRTLGFIDKNTKKVTEYDLCGVYRSEFEGVLKAFFETYEF
ncbi:hypothetical protein B5E84_19995 [Lachnoclostridium sp. An14]|uniref:hypothetical protein n=1 Tax=Lachnoclostridium sp. An14 TaxID=1965562 RepID=UPI000B370E6C|nr:hypothetical protein [Lachnoclostridium sp. An14]OUQ10712.1 hypothetical protein B5E84_19995 [Lachnoclostridium sp. An14]